MSVLVDWAEGGGGGERERERDKKKKKLLLLSRSGLRLGVRVERWRAGIQLVMWDFSAQTVPFQSWECYGPSGKAGTTQPTFIHVTNASLTQNRGCTSGGVYVLCHACQVGVTVGDPGLCC